MRTAKSRCQRLKQDGFCRTFVVAKATTHKDPEILEQTLKPLFFRPLNVAAEQAAEKVVYFLIPSEARNLSSI